MFLLKTAYKNNVFTTYDPNWRPKRLSYVSKAKKRIFSLFRYVSLLKLSETDALGITNKKTLSSAIQFLPKNTVITLGENGSFFWDGKKKIYAESFKVKVKDNKLEAEASGDKVSNYEIHTHVKAVTYSEMFVKKEKGKFITQVVLDV